MCAVTDAHPGRHVETPSGMRSPGMLLKTLEMRLLGTMSPVRQAITTVMEQIRANQDSAKQHISMRYKSANAPSAGDADRTRTEPASSQRQ